MLNDVIDVGNGLISSIRSRDNRLPDAYVNLVDEWTLNARTTKFNGKYFIGINAAAIVLLKVLFFRMLSNPKILISYGDILKEVESPKIHNAQITCIEHLYLQIDDLNPLHFPVPKDPARKSIAEFLSYTAIKYLILHEYGHIVMGHLEYKNEVTNSFSFNEVFCITDSKNQLNPLISQTLEMDADSYATNASLSDLQIIVENMGQLPDDVKFIYKNFKESFSLWVFSIYSFFRLFGNKKDSVEQLKTSFYPTTGMRQISMVTLIAKLYAQNGKKYTDELFQIALQSSAQVEKSFAEISEQGIGLESIEFAVRPEAKEHFGIVLKNWNNVRPHLEPFAKANLAPVVE